MNVFRRTPMLLAAVLLSVGSALPSCGGSDAGSSTACSIPEDLEVPRIDERNHRYFVVATVEDLEEREPAKKLLKRLAEHVGECHPDWKDRWSISFITEEKFAGYKDEAEILPRVKDGSWYHGYLAEYSRRRGVLVLFPVLPESRVEIKE